MKKIFCLVCFFLALFSLKSIADGPEGAIPFVFDGHLYLQSTLNDTIPYNRGIQMYRFPNSDVQKSVIF